MKNSSLGGQQEFIHSYLATTGQAILALPALKIERFAQVIFQAHQEQRMLFACGNGGSAACASHFIEDVIKGIHPADGRRIRGLALTDSVPLITAWANDNCYEDIFAEQLRNFVSPRDVVLGISGSGNSENVLRALALANQVGATTLALGGRDGGRMKELASDILIVPVQSMQQIEDAHLVCCHLIYLCLERLLRGACS